MKPAIPDEKLMAYADGELEANEMDAMRDRLAGDSTLRQRLQAFTETSPIAGPYDEIMSRPVPAALSAVLAVPPATAKSAAPAGGGFLRTLAAMFEVPRAPWALGVAFSTCVVVGAATGWIVSRLAATSATPTLLATSADGQVIAGRLLASALETSPMQVAVNGIEGGSGLPMKISPVGSFEAKDHRPCRQFDISIGSAGRGIEGVACRDAVGRWSIEGQAATMRTAQANSNEGEFKTLSGSDAMDGVIERLMSGAKFGPQVERKWLDRQWRKPD